MNSVNKIVEELVYNSLDAGANEIMIKLSLNDPNCLCLEVRDNGGGIGLTSLQAYCGTDFGATSKLETTTTSTTTTSTSSTGSSSTGSGCVSASNAYRYLF